MLISFAVTAKLICMFVFAYAKCWFSHDAAHMFKCQTYCIIFFSKTVLLQYFVWYFNLLVVLIGGISFSVNKIRIDLIYICFSFLCDGGRGGLVVNTSDSGSNGRGFKPHSGHRVVSLSKTYLPKKSTGNTQEAVALSQHD